MVAVRKRGRIVCPRMSSRMALSEEVMTAPCLNLKRTDTVHGHGGKSFNPVFKPKSRELVSNVMVIEGTGQEVR